MRRALAVVLLAQALSGCITLAWEVEKSGSPAGILAAHRLEPGKSTIRDVLALMGPPDLLLRVGLIDRAYYVAWDSDYIKLIISAPIPTVGKRSLDAFIIGGGSEDLRMVRLEFNQAGTLVDLQRGDFLLSRDGQSVAMDNRIVETFIEDRARSLRIVEKDDDDEDVEPPKK